MRKPPMPPAPHPGGAAHPGRSTCLRSWCVFAGATTMGRQASILLLLGVFLTSLTLPRFGLLWHAHEAREKAHAYHELLRLLASHAARAQHGGHAHEHDAAHAHGAAHVHHAPPAQATAGPQVFFAAASTSNLHAHYFDDTLLVYCSFIQTLSGAVLYVLLQVYRSLSYVSRQLLPPAARAPPSSHR